MARIGSNITSTDGRTAYSEKGCTYPGKWWLQNGEVCYAYPTYRDGEPNCFVLFVRPNGAIQFVAFGVDGTLYRVVLPEDRHPGTCPPAPQRRQSKP